MSRLKVAAPPAIAISLAAILLLIILVAHGSSDIESTAALKRVVIDQAGRRVELPQTVNRVDTSYRIATEIIMGLGAGDKLVGMDAASRGQADFYSKFLPSFASRPTTGSALGDNAEEIVALRPDVVFVSLVKGSGIAKIKQLSSAGINAIGIKCESPRELIEGVRLIGHILGAEERAEEYVSFYNNVRKMISTRLRGLKSSQRVRVYISGSGGILSSCGRKMYQSTVIDQAGGRNVASSISAGGWANVSPEQLIRWNPSVIFAVQYGHSMTPCPATPEDIIKDSRFSTIDAIKNGRVYMFPSNISPWDYPSMQSVLGLLWAAKTLHPDRFKDINMTRFANEFYLKFFGKSFRQAGGSL